MSLFPGTRLGVYEVTSVVGAGGMGEVFRARDTKLQRDVAIKVLPQAFALDGDRLARFEREAQALAALNHPNIAQIYGLVDLPGGSHALVMEFVDGEDLAQRLQRGPMPPDDAIAVARQIAGALETAHERGIIHRDLKPANVKLAADGTAKVLDFGLAKAAATDASSSLDAALSPTFTSPAMTQMGVLLGTAAYMSPEQAKGKPVDRRADIWAFGVVLFEMLTAKTVFSGETVTDTIAAVVTRDPDWAALPPGVPPVVRVLLRRCLERDPRKRLRDIGEARILLEDPAAAWVHGGAEGVDAATVPARRRSRAWWLGAAAVVLAATVLLAIAISKLAPMPAVTSPAGAAHFTFSLDPVGADSVMAAISPDGRHIAIVGANGVWLRPMADTSMRQLVTGQQPHVVFWSPDSRWIGFATGDALMKVGVEGGSPVAIADVSQLPGPFNPYGGGVWLPDGSIVFTTGFTGLMQVSAAGGEPALLVAPARPTEDFHGLSELPGGGFLTVVHEGASVDTIVALREGTRTMVWHAKGQDVASPRYSATGHLLFDKMASGEMWALPFDAKTLTVTGEAFLVLRGASFPSVSAEGYGLVASREAAQPSGFLALVSPDGRQSGRIGPPQVSAPFGGASSLSSDGKRAVLVTGGAARQSASIYPVDGGLATQVADGTSIFAATWMPGDREVLIVKGQRWCLSADCFEIERRSDTGGAARTIATGWSPTVGRDSKWMVYSTRSDTEWDLVALPLDGSGPAVPFQGGPGWQFGAQFSPDGRYVAFMSTEQGRSGIFVAPFPSGEKRRVPGGDGSYWPRWSRDGRRLFFARGTGVFAVDVSTESSFAAGEPRQVLADGSLFQIAVTRWPSPFDVSPDGRFLLYRPDDQAPRGGASAHVLFDWLRR